MKVKMYFYSEGNAQHYSTWTLDRAGIAVSDNERDTYFAEKEGVSGLGKTFYPKDGEAFLRALPIQFSGSYVWAELEE